MSRCCVRLSQRAQMLIALRKTLDFTFSLVVVIAVVVAVVVVGVAVVVVAVE